MPTDSDELKSLRELIKAYVPYVLATLPLNSKFVTNTNVTCSDPNYGAVHLGRSSSSRNQLEALLKKAKGTTDGS